MEGPMPETTALARDMREALQRTGRADLLVGIPSYKNAATIGHVARTAAEGLRRHFPDARGVIVNADGGSDDGTCDRVRESADGIPRVAGRYQGRSGKGSAFRAIFEAAGMLGVRACAVVDSDLRSITPDWIARLLGPVARGEADYVTPLYARHKHDGTITNTIAYPLTRGTTFAGLARRRSLERSSRSSRRRSTRPCRSSSTSSAPGPRSSVPRGTRSSATTSAPRRIARSNRATRAPSPATCGRARST